MRALRLLPVLFIIASCTSSNTTTDGSVPEDSGKTDAKKDAIPPPEAGPTCETTMMCAEQDKPMMGSPLCMLTLVAKFVDTAGAPIAGETIYLCGTNICTNPLQTDPMGIFAPKPPICTWFIAPALKYLGDHRFVSFASGTPMGVQKVMYANPITLTALPMAGVAFPTSGAITSNMVTLTLGANTMVKYDPSEPTDVETQKFRAVEVPLAKAPPDIDPALKLEVLWGLAPVNAALSPPTMLTVPNTKNWAPNAVVEFFLNGVDTFDLNPPAPYGKFGPIGTGKVSGNGTTVSTDVGMGNGVPMLGIVGVRLK